MDAIRSKRLCNFVLVYEIPFHICLLAFFMQITFSSNAIFVVLALIFKRLAFKINWRISIEFVQLKFTPSRERGSGLRVCWDAHCVYDCCNDNRCQCWPSVTNLIAHRDINFPFESNKDNVFIESVVNIETSILSIM